MKEKENLGYFKISKTDFIQNLNDFVLRFVFIVSQNINIFQFVNHRKATGYAFENINYVFNEFISTFYRLIYSGKLKSDQKQLFYE